MTKFCKFGDICILFAEISRKLLFFKPIFCENFEIAALQKDANLVELEKCCRTHILAKIRFDTAENEPAKNLQNFRKNLFEKCGPAGTGIAPGTAAAGCPAAGGQGCAGGGAEDGAAEAEPSNLS